MTYLRVSVGTWTIDLTSEQGRDMIQRIEDEGVEVIRSQPGFIRYRLMEVDPHTTVAVAEWESRELGQVGAERFRAWLRSSGVFQHLSLQTYDGDVVAAS